MKKLLFFCVAFLSFLMNAQESEMQFKKIIKLNDLAVENLDNRPKLDSILAEITIIRDVAANDEVLQKSKDAIKTIIEYNQIKDAIVPANDFSILTSQDLKEFDYRYDKFDKKYIINPMRKGEIYPYLVLTDSGVYLRFVNIYKKNSFIFWNKARFLYDGKTFEYTDESTRTSSSSSYNRYLGTTTSVTEESDVFCTKEMIAFLREITTATTVEGRLQGKNNYYDYTIGEKTKLRIAKVLELYDKLKK
ncbi:hypothetical protein [Chryseobacterium sp. YIM B08800]|uniref:hypothetical protein n=1 Tax=Chryseobacterium sp. YIM B08800 TaxID=2984136 RepID=UPI0022400C41|nr:hypothetical protein [Chryseobacterium sp. YIM B08800]